MQNHFDQVASSWDMNRMHHERTNAIATAMIKAGVFRPGQRGLEFGAGTGLLSIALKDYFETIQLLDSSPEMVRVTQEKLDTQGIQHLTPICLDLETADFTQGFFDVLFSQMAVHHAGNIRLLLEKFHALLNPGGQLFIADLYAEDGSFHEGAPGVHHGFDPEELAVWCAAAGYINMQHQTVFTMHKTAADGSLKTFPVFLFQALRP